MKSRHPIQKQFITSSIMAALFVLLLISCSSFGTSDSDDIAELKHELLRRYKASDFKGCISISDLILERSMDKDLSVRLIRAESFIEEKNYKKAGDELSYLDVHRKSEKRKFNDHVNSLINGKHSSSSENNYGFDPQKTLSLISVSYSYYLNHKVRLHEGDTTSACSDLNDAISLTGHFITDFNLPCDYPFSLQTFGVGYTELQQIRYSICIGNSNYTSQSLDQEHIERYRKKFSDKKIWNSLKYQSVGGRDLDFSHIYTDTTTWYFPLEDRRTLLNARELILFRWSYTVSKYDLRLNQILDLYKEVYNKSVDQRSELALKLGYETFHRSVGVDFDQIREKSEPNFDYI